MQPSIEAEVLKKINATDNNYQVINLAECLGSLHNLKYALSIVNKAKPKLSVLMISATVSKLAFMCKCFSGNENDANAFDWVNHATNSLSQKCGWNLTYHNDRSNDSIVISGTPDVNNLPPKVTFFFEKMSDEMVSHGFGYLRKHKLIVDEEDEYVLDPVVCGIGSW